MSLTKLSKEVKELEHKILTIKEKIISEKITGILKGRQVKIECDFADYGNQAKLTFKNETGITFNGVINYCNVQVVFADHICLYGTKEQIRDIIDNNNAKVSADREFLKERNTFSRREKGIKYLLGK